MADERWKTLPGEFQFYEVSTTGKVRNILTGRVLKMSKTKGRHTVTLSGTRKPTTFDAGRLVAQAFLPDWSSKKKVYRRDGDITNDNVENLYLQY